MPTLRRILKYTPAVVMGLLVVAWVVSLLGSAEVAIPIELDERRWWCGLIFQGGSCSIGYTTVDHLSCFSWRPMSQSGSARGYLGVAYFDYSKTFGSLDLPFACLLTAILPLAIGPFVSFRFRLWHYLAYTALVAVELAYYLRWQD